MQLRRNSGAFCVPEPMLDLSPVRAMLTTGLSLPMTILAALHAHVTDAAAATKLTAHIVGAAANEIMSYEVYTEILNWLTKCQILRICLVGP
jgi:hypothetical protein